MPSYQLAVVVDDMRQGVTDVVRGDDLLSSAARQTLLYRALGHSPPQWWHVPLVNGPDGRRLAKRDNLVHVSAYRDAGASPQRIIGLLATWCGVSDHRAEMDLRDFLSAFRIDTLPRSPITLTRSDLQWLLQQA